MDPCLDCPEMHCHKCALRDEYVSYQGRFALKREQAEAYLSWLDEGNVGKHWDCEQGDAQ